jgi:hypothetical protein
VPGYFYEDDDDEGRAKIFWFGDRVVRIVSFLVSSGGPNASTPQELVESSTAPAPGRGQPASRFAIDAPPLSGYCVVLDPAEGESARHAHAVLERPGRMVLLTITFVSPADSAWVESVVRSVTLRAPEGN